jgi:hypothetical protein
VRSLRSVISFLGSTVNSLKSIAEGIKDLKMIFPDFMMSLPHVFVTYAVQEENKTPWPAARSVGSWYLW